MSSPTGPPGCTRSRSTSADADRLCPTRHGTLADVIDLTRRATDVAPDLLGAVLRFGPVAVRLTEVEAYEGTDDLASHAWRGPTPRTQVMFGPAGYCYVYRSYGMHWCMNIVCGPDGRAAAVLLRAGEIVDGLGLARARRPGVPDHRLARGPGCLTLALGITQEHDGARLGDPGAPVLVGREQPLDQTVRPAPEIAVGPRVGVSRAADEQRRFWLAGEPTVSAYRRSARG